MSCRGLDGVNVAPGFRGHGSWHTQAAGMASDPKPAWKSSCAQPSLLLTRNERAPDGMQQLLSKVLALMEESPDLPAAPSGDLAATEDLALFQSLFSLFPAETGELKGSAHSWLSGNLLRGRAVHSSPEPCDLVRRRCA